MLKLKTILQSKVFFICLVVVTIIYTLSYIYLIPHPSRYKDGTVTLTGQIIKYQINGDYLNLRIKTPEIIQVNYYIKSIEEQKYLEDKLAYGLTITLDGKLSKPNNNTIPHAFNYRKYLYYEYIYYVMDATNYQIIKDTNLFFKIKNYFFKRINNNQDNAYLKAFVLGDKSDIEKEIVKNYQSNGISHLLAISGMHISLFSLIILTIFKKYKYKEILNLGILWFYVLLIGFSPSILRAIIFFTIHYFNKKLKLDYSLNKCLLITGILIILFNPFNLFNLGFQYSFITSYFLLMANNFIKSNSYLKQLFKVSFIATLISLPITIYNFYEINFFSVFTNLIFVPLITFIYYPLALITYLFSFLAPFYAYLINLLEQLNNLIAKITFLKIVIPKISILTIIIYYLFLYLTLKYSKKFIISLIIILIFWKYQTVFHNELRVYYLDVGQGDCALITNIAKKTSILIDTGGKLTYPQEDWQEKNTTNNTANNLILFFKSLGLTKIDYLILSHGDFDHIGNSLDLIKKYQFTKVIFNKGGYNDLEKQLITLLETKNIEYQNNLNEINLNDIKLTFLNTNLYNNENDNSLVTYFKYLDYQFLFMGDASINVEKNLLNKYNLHNIDILKVGHHGSNTSTSKEFITTINPQYAVISVGKNNRYNHPHKEVIANLINSKIYRTDLQGTILFKIKNNYLNIKINAL